MKIAVLEPLGIPYEELKEKVEKAAGLDNEVVCYETREEDTPTLIERSQEADMVVLSNFRYGRDVMEKCPDLKYICVAFTGYDHVDMDYCREKGITVSNCAGYSTVAVADLVFGFVIDLYRNIIRCNEVVRESGTKAGLIATGAGREDFRDHRSRCHRHESGKDRSGIRLQDAGIFQDEKRYRWTGIRGSRHADGRE